MALPTGELQTAFIARYRGDSTLQGLLTGATSPLWNIFDAGGVPTNQAFPYLVIFPITGRTGTALSMGGDAVDVYMQVQCFSQAAGFKVARAIMKQVYSLTQEYSFSLTGGFTNFFTLFDNEQELPEPDGLTQMIAHRYRCMMVG